MKGYVTKNILVYCIFFLLVGIYANTTIGIESGQTSQPPEVVYVDDDFNPSTPGWGYDHFDKIQDGITAVQVNGTVIVYSGIYYENLEIIKSLKLEGEKASTTIIDGRNKSDVVSIRKDWSSINGFTIKNGTHGIMCSANNVQISGNIISENYGWGVFLSGSENVVTGNSIDNNGHYSGTIGASGGVYLVIAFSCKIIKNNIRNNLETNAFFFKSMFNIWSRNYWDKARILPYLIIGIQAIIPPIFWLKIDWLPAKIPYEISQIFAR